MKRLTRSTVSTEVDEEVGGVDEQVSSQAHRGRQVG
jgi:hypothetical protein